MKSLQNLALIDLSVHNLKLVFGLEVPPVAPACRLLTDAHYAFMDASASGPSELYYMYRDVARIADRPAVTKHGLRYDVTLIAPGAVGPEFNKTVGHYHPLKTNTALTYPEVYEVLMGEATYLLQKPGPSPGEISDVYVLVCQPGDKAVIPPGYGHITINAGSLPLVMANWVAAEFESVYGEIKSLRGGAYYLLSSGQWINNPLYSRVPPLRHAAPQDYPEFGLTRGRGMYELIAGNPAQLRFLTHPEEYPWT